MNGSNSNQSTDTSTRPQQCFSQITLICTVILVVVVIVQAVSMARRASRGESDISVFYRTATLLNHGAGGELYASRDQLSGWYHIIPPAGLVIFLPLALLSPTTSATIWALINLALLAGATIALYHFIGKLDNHRSIYQNAFPWAIIILLFLSTGSIQVGQFSVLFVTCWIFYLYATASGRNFWAGMSLAIPTAIKLYPALMVAVPLASGRHRRLLLLSYFLLGILIVFIIAPVIIYGPRALDLTTSFFQNAILSPEGRVAGYLDTGAISNQSLEAVLLRYLSHSHSFHSRFPSFPHLGLEHYQVVLLSNAIWLIVIIISIVVVTRWKRRMNNNPVYSTLLATALWSTTLYVILPETKARYAVYTFIGFLPLIGAAVHARERGDRLGSVSVSIVIIFCLVVIGQLIPSSIRAYGVGLLGALVLWFENVRRMSVINGSHQRQEISQRPKHKPQRCM